MLDSLFHDDAVEGFGKCISALEREFGKVRTGRANLALIDGVKVDYYGSSTAITQVATCSIPDARTISIKPWDKGMLGTIEKALLAADVGITPNNDGTLIRLPVPPLTTERRQELVKQIKKMGEGAKVSVRSVRRDVKDLIESAELPEDDMHKQLKELQDLTNSHVADIDKLVSTKEKEVLED